MLSISKIGNSVDAVKYYTEYALEQGEAEGKWVGRAAEKISKIYENPVNSEDMQLVLSGKAISGKPLVKAGDKHTPGWDLTFSAPKSVSVAWANSDTKLRGEIEVAQEAAVRDALDYLEEHSARSRVGKGGKESIKSELITGLFQHSSNRDLEPQLHTHSVIANVSYGADGKWRTLDSRHIYKDQRAISAVYKASLSHRMCELGFGVDRTKNSFEISGIGQEIRDYFSSRSKAIEKELAAQGVTRSGASREQKETVTLKSRKKKEKGSHVESARDFDRWQEESRANGFSRTDLESMRKIPVEKGFKKPSDKALDQLAHESLKMVTEQKSVFEKVDFHSYIAEEMIGKGSYSDIKKSISVAHSSDELAHMRPDPHRAKFSTREMMKIEKDIYHSVKSRLDEGRHVVREKTIRSLIAEKYPTILPEQLDAMNLSTRSKSGVTYLQGVAGAGKSYTMNAVKDAFERDGYFVTGIAPTNKAARELSESTKGMETSSIHSFLYRLEKGSVGFSSRSVLIVDEGGMAGSKLQHKLLMQAKKAKAKVIILGDSKQIQPIEAGQIFSVMHRLFGKKELRNVVRQTDKREGAVLLKVRDATEKSDIKTVIDYLVETKRFNLAKDTDASLSTLMNDWNNHRKEAPESTRLVVASRNETVDSLNCRIRQQLKDEGTLKDTKVFIRRDGTGIELAVNDRIVFTESKKLQGIYRSDLATVVSINGSRVKAEISKGNFVSFDMKKFSDVSHGYAVTTHRSQGTTVDRAFVYADGPFMDREKTYVGLTRGRGGNRLYADEASLGGMSWDQTQATRKMKKDVKAAYIRDHYMSRLTDRIFKSSRKTTTLDYRMDDYQRNGASTLMELVATFKKQSEKVLGRLRSPSKSADKSIDK